MDRNTIYAVVAIGIGLIGIGLALYTQHAGKEVVDVAKNNITAMLGNGTTI